jgi:hypothetical protein
MPVAWKPPISDHQQSWGYEDGPWKRPGPPLLVPLIFKKNFFTSNIIYHNVNVNVKFNVKLVREV